MKQVFAKIAPSFDCWEMHGQWKVHFYNTSLPVFHESVINKSRILIKLSINSIVQMSNQNLSETLTQVVTYILQRVSSSNSGDKDALIQEYSEWLQCLGNPYLICNNILFINTLTFKDAYLKD